MPDEIDLLTEQQQTLLDARLAAARGGRPTAAPSLVCVACGQPIPEARRKAVPQCCLCVDCQAERETGET